MGTQPSSTAINKRYRNGLLVVLVLVVIVMVLLWLHGLVGIELLLPGVLSMFGHAIMLMSDWHIGAAATTPSDVVATAGATGVAVGTVHHFVVNHYYYGSGPEGAPPAPPARSDGPQ